MNENSIDSMEEIGHFRPPEFAIEPTQDIPTFLKIRKKNKPWFRNIPLQIYKLIIVVVAVACIGIYFIVKKEQPNPNHALQSGNISLLLNSGSTQSNRVTMATVIEKLGTFANPGKSCLQMKERGLNISGYYVIMTDNRTLPMTVYCDMETSGGGWTLVATVHENDIDGKCTTGDLWFSNEISPNSSMTFRNWENRNTFGSIDLATSTDYKNKAYYSMKASDVMVRHAPNGQPLTSTKASATLEYHTDNQFLREYGGNLYGVYTKYYPLTPINKVYYPQATSSMLDALAGNSSFIVKDIPHFYEYVYNGNRTRALTNGGNGLFTDHGMQLYVALGLFECKWSVTYGQEYRCSRSNVIMDSRMSHPFFALMTLGNFHWTSSFFYARIRSLRPATDLSATHSGTLYNGNFILRYNALCRYNMTSPSICDVMYLVTNKKDWGSPDSISFPASREFRTSSEYYFYQHVESYPSNAVFGYTMLSRTGGRFVTKHHTDKTMRNILSVISSFPDIAPECADPRKNLVVPVNFTIGGATAISMIPPNLRNDVTIGYLQLRARSIAGSAYAFCPAIKATTCATQYLCVGGVKYGYSQSEDCGDLLEWNGLERSGNINRTHAQGFSHALSDIESTIMIFYR